MTEEEWLACDEPYEMLEFLIGTRKASGRRFRLFAVACSRRIWDSLYDTERRALSIAERCLDGPAGEAERAAAYEGLRRAAQAGHGPGDPPAALDLLDRDARFVAQAVMSLMPEPPHATGEEEVWCGLCRCIFADPFRPPRPVPEGVLAWDGGLIVEMAAAIDEEGDFTRERMGVLGDAMEEAGFGDASLLGHLRGPGPHARGCHAIDLILGRE